ncbi:MAG TPA: DUF1465 family protein [Alphaproteobacteria bacterium]|nr:DUF1465 family protein [Alphaproteobacteria bacterium]
MIEPLAFIDTRLQGAQKLLHATHDYIKWQAPLDVKRMDQKQAFKVSCEAMRVTVRMTQIIAWLMLQRAVLEGEISRNEVLLEECRVLRGEHCLEDDSEMDEDLPPRLRELLKESRELYVRILRLDENARNQEYAQVDHSSQN